MRAGATRAALWLAVATVTACTVGPSYRRPRVDVPPAYGGASAGGGRLDATWWRLFGDERLSQLERRHSGAAGPPATPPACSIGRAEEVAGGRSAPAT